MRTTVIPAQIMTLEDKIAGNLSFVQICFLMFPVMWSMLVFMLFPPAMKFVLYKLPIILLVSLISFIMAIRIKERIIFNWLITILKFNLRPTYYVFTKNDTYLRILDLPTVEKTAIPAVQAAPLQTVVSPASEHELVQLNRFMRKRKHSVVFKPDKKGDFHVALH
jgi:hypothetical protein